jgi:hypothetical protein
MPVCPCGMSKKPTPVTVAVPEVRRSDWRRADRRRVKLLKAVMAARKTAKAA